MLRKRKPFLARNKFLLFGSGVGIFLFVVFVSLIVGVVTAEEALTIEFPSLDGLTITADDYIVHDTATSPFIILFHQAKWSRGEYRETAPKFNQLGYNCIAVDLRAGSQVKGVDNLTALRAIEAGKQTRFIDAMQDMIAAINYVREHYQPKTLLILGSSYSAGLALKIAGDHGKIVDGVLAFSPGEYFTKNDMPPNWVASSAKQFAIPVFITSARKEKHRWINIYNEIRSKSKFSYTPATKGKHGSRALWEQFPDSESYWTVVQTFLKSYF